MRQTLELRKSGHEGYIIQTVSREQVLDLADGDYDVTDAMSEILSGIWGDVDMTGCFVRIANG